MPPIMMTRPERAALRMLARGALPASDMPPQHARKLVKHGLAAQEALWLTITAKGQLELLRQRYRNMTARAEIAAEDDFQRKPPESLSGR